MEGREAIAGGRAIDRAHAFGDHAVIPAAAILFAQVLMGAIVGALGVAVATPLAAAVMVAVSMLYVEDALGDRNAKPGS